MLLVETSTYTVYVPSVFGPYVQISKADAITVLQDIIDYSTDHEVTIKANVMTIER